MPDDRLEVVDVEAHGIEVAVPADDVERMVVEHDLVDAVVLLHQDGEIAHLVVGAQLQRTPDVALRVRRALDQLAELVAVALGPAHVAAALEDHESFGCSVPKSKLEAVHDAAVDHDVVAFADGRLPKIDSSVPLPFATYTTSSACALR
jgi:hypothetical protein